jgi:protein KRI1
LEDEDLASNSSDETSEDENAELLTGRVETKIFETLSKIKAKDPSIYDPEAAKMGFGIRLSSF